MERTTLSIPDELLSRLRKIAAERRVSMAAVIREALEEKVDEFRPAPRSLGSGASGKRKGARNVAGERQPPRPWR